MKKKSVTVVMENPNDIPAKIIADSILEISRAMKKIQETRLTRKAIVALIHDQSKLGKTQIELVLKNLEALEDTWLRKPKAS